MRAGGRKAPQFESLDLSILYTKRPHDSLKTNLKDQVKEAHKVRRGVLVRGST